MTEHLSSDEKLTSYLEGFDDALDSAAITCARCATLERRIAELTEALMRARCELESQSGWVSPSVMSEIKEALEPKP